MVVGDLIGVLVLVVAAVCGGANPVVTAGVVALVELQV